MKYIITENKLERAIIHFLNKGYGNLTEYRTDKFPNRVFYIRDGEIYMDLDLETNKLLVDYDSIWSDLMEWFSLKYKDVQSVISKWAEDTYNISGVIPTYNIEPMGIY